MSEFHAVIQTLQQPEYVHVLLNPLPVYGTLMGALALTAGLVTRNRAIQAIGLALVFLATLSVWPVIEYGQAGADRVQSMVYKEGQQWLNAHAQRAERFEPLFYVTAGLAVAALVALWKFPKLANWLPLVTLLLAVACIAAGGWIGHAGGQIRHNEFRNGPPPTTPEEEHEH